MGSGVKGLEIFRIFGESFADRCIHQVGDALICFGGLEAQRPVEGRIEIHRGTLGFCSHKPRIAS